MQARRLASRLKIEGTYTALVTPFTADAQHVDYTKLRELVEWQIQEGINGLVVLGSTGENQCVSTQEREQILATVVETTKNRVPVVAGTSSNSTAATIQLTQDAKAAGVDACMVMSPYYSLPSQRGLYEHFKAVAEVGLPVMLYNNPGRAGVTILPETVARLADVPGIVAVKEATGNVAQVRVSLDRLSTLGVADTFTRTWLGRQATEIAALCDLTIFGGEDTLALPLMSIGATGVMSVLSNAAPGKVLALTNAFMRGDYATAQKIHLENFLLANSLFVEASPQPIKQAMELLGLCSASVRAPLTACSEETVALLKQQLQANNLL